MRTRVGLAEGRGRVAGVAAGVGGERGLREEQRYGEEEEAKEGEAGEGHWW